MLSAALAELDLVRTLYIDNPLVWAVLRSDADHWVLFLLNLFTAPQRVRVKFRDPVRGTLVDTGLVDVTGTSVAIWPPFPPP